MKAAILLFLPAFLIAGLTPSQEIISFHSGNGIGGGNDARITCLIGPRLKGFGRAFSPADFSSAKNGPNARILPTHQISKLWAPSLASDPRAKWIEPGSVYSWYSALYAISFNLPEKPKSAKFILHFAADDKLGDKYAPPVYLNGKVVKNTQGIGSFDKEYTFQENDITPLLVAGTNILFLYGCNLTTGNGRSSALIFSAKIILQPTGKHLFSPDLYAPDEGNSYEPRLLGSNNPIKWQQIHDDVTGMAKNIFEIAFRREGIHLDTFYPLITNITLGISTSTKTSITASSYFPNNHGVDLKEVLSKKTIVFQPSYKPAIPPAPFQYPIPFDKPFPYSGKGSLCWEMDVHSTTGNQNYAWLDFISNSVIYVGIGKGCYSGKPNWDRAGHTAKLVSGTRGWDYYALGRNFDPNQPFLWQIGVDILKWGPINLPFYVPGSNNCHVYVAPVISVGGMADANGKIDMQNSPLQFAKAPLVSYVSLYSQIVAATRHYPNFPLTFSNGYEVIVPPYYPPALSAIWGLSGSSSGSVYKSSGLFIRLSY